jgi:hypothetical protein
MRKFDTSRFPLGHQQPKAPQVILEMKEMLKDLEKDQVVFIMIAFTIYILSLFVHLTK